VANHFLKKSNNKTQVNHIDFNTKNNYVDNLEWVTSSENIQHLLKNKGISNQFTKFSKVAQYDMDGNLLNVFGSPLDAIKFLDIKNKNGKYDSRGINYCCRNKQKSYKNFMWKYFKNKPLKKINKYKSKKSSLSRKIKSIDKNGNIRIFNSITDASIFLNIRRSDISSVLIGRQKTAKGVSFYYLKNN
jgi:hypothetical protein